MQDNSDMSVSIVIVTSGSRDYLRHCLDSVKAQSYPDCEVIVIDNSLNPGLSANIRASYPLIKVCSNQQNLYYGVSQNLGIGISCGEFILCLNDDVVLDENFICQALKGFLIKNNVGMVSGKILRPDGLTLDSTGLFLSFGYAARERGYGRIDTGRFEKPGFIFGVSGSVAFYRRKMLEDIKEGQHYFDPRFRMFYEDLDVSWRANRRGWKAYYTPLAKAFHVRGGSLRQGDGLDKAFARRYINDELHSELIKNRYLAILKNANPFILFLHLIPIWLYDLCAWGYVLIFRPKVVRIFLSKLRFSKI